MKAGAERRTALCSPPLIPLSTHLTQPPQVTVGYANAWTKSAEGPRCRHHPPAAVLYQCAGDAQPSTCELNSFRIDGQVIEVTSDASCASKCAEG